MTNRDPDAGPDAATLDRLVGHILSGDARRHPVLDEMTTAGLILEMARRIARVVNLNDYPRKVGRTGRSVPAYSPYGRELPQDVVVVCRPSRWGNPYLPGRDGTRDEVIALYRSWLSDRLAADPDFLEPLRGKRLACWCAPLACHADVLAELIP